MKYIKHIKVFEDMDAQEEVQSQEVQDPQTSTHDVGDKDADLSELISALKEGLLKTNEESNTSKESGEGDYKRCLETAKVIELTLWCVENNTKYWEKMVEYCLAVSRECVEYSMGEGIQLSAESLMKVVAECENIVDEIG
jgi:hypothetical protein